MPRKGPAPKRPIDIDPVYGSKNPFAFMELQDVQELSNFFERRVSAYQVGVSGSVSSSTPIETRLLIWRKLCLKSRDNFLREIGLDGEDVGQIAVVIFRPTGAKACRIFAADIPAAFTFVCAAVSLVSKSFAIITPSVSFRFTIPPFTAVVIICHFSPLLEEIC